MSTGEPTRQHRALEALFEDLEQQAEGIQLADRDAELADRTRGEYARVRFADRVHASLGRQVTVVLSSGHTAEGTLIDAGQGWCLVAEDGRPSRWLLPLAAVAWAAVALGWLLRYGRWLGQPKVAPRCG